MGWRGEFSVRAVTRGHPLQSQPLSGLGPPVRHLEGRRQPSDCHRGSALYRQGAWVLPDMWRDYRKFLVQLATLLRWRAPAGGP